MEKSTKELFRKTVVNFCGVCYNRNMETVRHFAYAKLNLSLNVTGTAGGYHLLDSFVASIDLSDEVVLKERKDDKITVTMHGMGSESLSPEKNVAYLAAEAFQRKFSTRGADITVFKNIPMGAGVGGSSADAAGVIRGMARLYGVEDEKGEKELADALGSDTGYMLRGGFARITGRGTQVWRLDRRDTLWFLLLLPKTPVSTAAAYAEYDRAPDGRRSDTEACIGAFLQGRKEEMASHFYNALYAGASRLNPSVARAVEEISRFSPLGYGMTGSGSGVFALFPSRELCEWAKSRYTGECRAVVVRTVVPEEKEKKPILRNPFALSKEEQAIAENKK